MATSSALQLLAPAQIDGAVLLAFWNQTQPDELALAARALRWWIDAPALTRSALTLRRGGDLLGAALLSAPAAPDAAHVAHDAAPVGERAGWFDGLVVAGGRTRSVWRRRLLAGGEAWLRDQGCRAVALGGGPAGLVRGLQPNPSVGRFVRRLGYLETGLAHDMALDVARRPGAGDLQAPAGVVRPAQPRDRDEVEALLLRPLLDAPGSAAAAGTVASLRRLLAAGRLSDLMLLWTDRGLVGMVQVAFADSLWPVELAYPWTLARPWAALPALVVESAQPPGAFALLIDAALRRLLNNGVNSCVAPGVVWTAPWLQAGFHIERSWQRYVKLL